MPNVAGLIRQFNDWHAQNAKGAPPLAATPSDVNVSVAPAPPPRGPIESNSPPQLNSNAPRFDQPSMLGEELRSVAPQFYSNTPGFDQNPPPQLNSNRPVDLDLQSFRPEPEREPVPAGQDELQEWLGERGMVKTEKSLAAGAFGAVHELKTAEGKSTGKVVKISRNANDYTLVNEAAKIAKLDHPNLVHGDTPKPLNIPGVGLAVVMDYLAGGNLDKVAEWLKAAYPDKEKVKPGGANHTEYWGTVQHLTAEIMTGLNYLAENGMAHNDIKGANVMLDADGVVKIIDFGGVYPAHKWKEPINRSGSGVADSIVGPDEAPCTPLLSRQPWEREGTSNQHDTYAAGRIAHNLAEGKLWTPGTAEEFSGKGPGAQAQGPVKEGSDTYKDFVEKTLSKQDNSPGPTSAEALEHPFLKEENRLIRDPELAREVLRKIRVLGSDPENRKKLGDELKAVFGTDDVGKILANAEQNKQGTQVADKFQKIVDKINKIKSGEMPRPPQHAPKEIAGEAFPSEAVAADAAGRQAEITALEERAKAAGPDEKKKLAAEIFKKQKELDQSTGNVPHSSLEASNEAVLKGFEAAISANNLAAIDKCLRDLSVDPGQIDKLTKAAEFLGSGAPLNERVKSMIEMSNSIKAVKAPPEVKKLLWKFQEGLKNRYT